MLTEKDINQFIETFPDIEAEMDKKSAEHDGQDPFEDKQDLTSMMSTLFAYDWVREIFSANGWDEEFMTIKFPAIMSGVMIGTFEKSLGEMSDKQRAALQASGMMESMTVVFGRIHPQDKELVIKHLDELASVLDAGE